MDFVWGVMVIFEAATTTESGEEPTGTPIAANASGDEIQFKNFPIRALIVNVLGDEELVDQVVGRIGEVDYAIPYTDLMDEQKTTVKLMLAPEALHLVLGSTEPARAPHADEPVAVVVSISAAAEGFMRLNP